VITPFTPLKLLRHSGRVESMLAGEPTAPISVELDLSNHCPHDCPFCSFGTSASQGYRQQHAVSFPTPRLLTLLKELADYGVLSVTFTGGGEPLVHKQAAAAFEAAYAAGLDYGLVTNGVLLDARVRPVLASSAKFVRVSLDAGRSDTHQFSHGLSRPQFHTILGNMQELRSAAEGRPFTIGASFCVMDQNWKEIYQAAKLVRDHGGNYLEVRPTFPTDWRGDGWGRALADANVEAAKVEIEHARTHLNSDTFQVIGMVDRFDALTQTGKPYTQCRIGPLMTVIGADGRIWHCCVQRGQDFFSMGSVLDGAFADVWQEALDRRMSEAIDVTKCPKCRYDSYNTLIEKAFIKDGMHANFV